MGNRPPSRKTHAIEKHYHLLEVCIIIVADCSCTEPAQKSKSTSWHLLTKNARLKRRKGAWLSCEKTPVALDFLSPFNSNLVRRLTVRCLQIEMADKVKGWVVWFGGLSVLFRGLVTQHPDTVSMLDQCLWHTYKSGQEMEFSWAVSPSLFLHLLPVIAACPSFVSRDQSLVLLIDWW